IEWLVPYGPGGGFDTLTRLAAAYVGTHTGAKIAVVNMPGGGKMKAANYLYKIAEPDGLTLITASPPSYVPLQMLGAEGCEYDLPKFEWVANLNGRESIFFIDANLPYKTLADLRQIGELKITTGAPGDGVDMACKLILGEAMGMNLKMIYGESSSVEHGMMTMRGEVHAAMSNYSVAGPLFKEGTLRPLFALTAERITDMPDLPSVYEALPTDISADGKFWVDFVVGQSVLCRTVATSPGAPKDRVDFLREAFKKACAEEKLMSNAAKVGQALSFLSGEETQTMMVKMMDLNPDKLAKYKAMAGIK
ncbi:tripartite tricarboxylate transporter substrate-binding protein, partial [Candidatus Omnitrophota bacterium]